MKHKFRLALLLAACSCALIFGFYFFSKPDSPVLSASNLSVSGEIRLTWDPVSHAQVYEVYRSSDPSGVYHLIGTTESAAFTDPDTRIGASYIYQVTAISKLKTASDPSNCVNAVCKLSLPVLSVSNVSTSGKVRLTWDAVEEAQSYEISVSTDDKTWTLLASCTDTICIDDFAEAGDSKFYRVRAIHSNADASSDYSASATGVCLLPCPALSLSNNIYTGRVVLDWDPVDGAAEYKLFRAAGKVSEFEELDTTSDLTYTDSSSEAELAYYYKVRAVSEGGSVESADSIVRSGIYAYPDQLTLFAELDEDNHPCLVWNEIKNAVEYSVQYSFLKNGDSRQLVTVTDCSLIHFKAPQGVSIHYTVKAMDSSGTVLKVSNIASVTTDFTMQETLKTQYISVPIVKLYKAPDLDADSIALRYMDSVKLGSEILSSSTAAWYRIFYMDALYYIRIEADTPVLTGKKSSFTYSGNTEYQQMVLDLATDISENWNTVYISGYSGQSVKSGSARAFNCSGLVHYVFNTVMQKIVPTYKIPSTLKTLLATDIIYNNSYPGEFCAMYIEDAADLKPGDVLFFRSPTAGADPTKVSHCGIYLGNNEFVHSTERWEDAVCIIPLEGSYSDRLVEIRRFLPNSVTPANATETVGDLLEEYPIYAKMKEDSDSVAVALPGDQLTVLFSNSSWAYVRTADGTKGFFPIEYFC